MIAGLVLRISPPIEGSKATHHTSPRRGGLSGLIGGHRPIAFDDFPRDDVRPREIIEEAADPPSADDAVQPFVYVVIDRDRQLFGHPTAPYTYNIRIIDARP